MGRSTRAYRGIVSGGGGGNVSVVPWALTSNVTTDIDFVNDRGFNGNTAIGTSTSFLTTVRASAGYAADLQNNWTLFGNNVARRTNRGLLVEEARTNGVRNNSMQGAVAGAVVAPQTISTITNVTTTATITMGTNHGLNTGDLIAVAGTTPAAYSGNFRFTKTSNTAGTYVMASDPLGSATVVGTYTAFSAGTIPTNWSDQSNTLGEGCAILVIGTGTELGVDYVDLRFVGLPNETNNIRLSTDSETQIAAVYGQTWSSSGFVKQSGGLLTNVGTIKINSAFRNLSGSGLNPNTTNSQTLTGTLTRLAASVTGTDYTTAFIYHEFQLGVTNGLAIDVTVRLGWPQTENNPNLNATVASAARKADATAVFTNGLANITDTAHKLLVNSAVSFTTTGTLPTNFATATVYYIKTVVDANTYTVAATPGGTAITAGSAGTGTQTRTLNGFGGTNSTGTATVVGIPSGSATVTISNGGGGAGVVTDTAHGLAANTPVSFSTTGALPTGLVVGTVYYVLAPLTNSYNVSATPGGAAVNTSSAGSGVHTRISYNAGTGTAATLNVTIAGGILSTVNSVTTAGSYSVFAPGPTIISFGGLIGGSVILTPTDNSASAFVTSPIRTTGSALARLVDDVRLTSIGAFGTACTGYLQGTVQGSNGGASTGLTFTDGTAANDSYIYRSGTNYRGELDLSSVLVSNVTGGTWSLNASAKLGFATATGDAVLYANAAQIGTAVGVITSLPFTSVRLGTNQSTSAAFNGYVERIGIWLTVRVPNATLASITT